MHKVAQRGTLFYIVNQHSKPVGQGYVRREDAEESLTDLVCALQESIRSCMSCQKPFGSKGSHNRICPQCKRRATG